MTTTHHDAADGPLLPQLRYLLSLGIRDQVILMLTGRCNHACRFCAQDHSYDNAVMDLAGALERIASTPRPDEVILTFTGGEPTLLPYLPDLAAAAKARGFPRLAVQTNGVALADADYAARLAAAGVDHVFIPVFADDPATYASLSGSRPDHWRSSIDGMRNAHDAGMALEINALIVRRTASDFSRLCRFLLNAFPFLADSMDMPYHAGVSISTANPFGQAWEHRDEILTPFEELRAPLNEGMNLLRRHRVAYHNPVCGVPFCMAPDHIDASMEWAMPAVLGMSSANPLKRKAPQCQGCVYDSICPGTWIRFIDCFGEDVLTPLACLTAPLYIDLHR